MKLSLNGSLYKDKVKKGIDNNKMHSDQKNFYQTPIKTILQGVLSQSTLPRTNSADKKTFIKLFNKKENNQKLTMKSSIKEVHREQIKQHISPLLIKNCFQKGNKPLKTVDSIKKLNHSSSFSKKYYYGKTQQKKSIEKEGDSFYRQIQTQRRNNINNSKNSNINNNNNINNINNNQPTRNSLHMTSNPHPNTNSTILPTNYTSVKLFMSSKFKKGIKQKIPVNIFAHAESIHEKQAASELSLSQVSYRNLINSKSKLTQTIILN